MDLNIVSAASEWSCPAPDIDATQILRVHKYRDAEKVRPVIREAAEKAVQKAKQLARPEVRYKTSPILLHENSTVTLPEDVVFECGAFGRYLKGCEYITAFVATIGPDLDETVIALLEDTFEPLDALFLETAGWLSIERATKNLARHLRQEFAGLGWQLSLRMGPGYEYPGETGAERVSWDLWDQKQLFKVFGEESLPVTLSSACAMTPKMSRSGVYGLRKIPD